MGDAILDIRDLSVGFRSGGRLLPAVDNCRLQLRRGEILGIVGESGSGKTVTALSCLGLMPKAAEVSGSIRLGGRELVGLPERELAEIRGRRIALIFQNPMTALNPFFTIGAQLRDIVGRHRAAPRAALDRILTEVLAQVGLPDPAATLRKYPHQLSGGQIQRTMIALALACKPDVLIADEPTTALDVTVQAQIIQLLRDLAINSNLAVLFITHDLGLVASLCDHVAVMYAGQVVEQGPVRAIFKQPAHPYTRLLLATVPERGSGRGKLTAIAGGVPNLFGRPDGCRFHPRCPQAMPVCHSHEPAAMAVGTDHVAACHLANAALIGDAPIGSRKFAGEDR